MEYEKIGFSLHELAGRTLQALAPQAAAKKTLNWNWTFRQTYRTCALATPAGCVR